MNWPIIESNNGIKVRINDQDLLNFTSNDYLGLAQNIELKETMATAINKYGLGSTGSRRLSGNHRLFLDTEESIASWIGKESAVMFNSGYQMNVSIFSTIVSKSTLVIADKLIHASLVDGIQSSDAQLVRFRHNDTGHLAQLLKKYAHNYSDILIVCESVYSMDGDTAPIHEIIQLKNDYQARLLVDEAHSIGLFGEGGNGWVNEKGILNEVDILLVPFGKAFGLSGAMFLSNQELAARLKAKCRGYIYSTALPLPVAIGIKEASKIIQSSQSLRQNLQQNIQAFKSQLDTISDSQIQPIIIGDNNQASSCEKSLIEAGFFVRAVHHPTVPKGQSRLRITLTACHTVDEVLALAHQIKTVLSPVGSLA